MIPSSFYEQVKAVMPIPSVEAIIMKDDSFLFLRRKNSPAKGEWWFPGGRIRKGETFKETLFRKVKEETGLEVDITKKIGVFNRIFSDRHDIAIVFLCRCFDEKVILSEEHSEFKFTRDIPSGIHPYLLETIQKTGIISSNKESLFIAENKRKEYGE